MRAMFLIPLGNEPIGSMHVLLPLRVIVWEAAYLTYKLLTKINWNHLEPRPIEDNWFPHDAFHPGLRSPAELDSLRSRGKCPKQHPWPGPEVGSGDHRISQAGICL